MRHPQPTDPDRDGDRCTNSSPLLRAKPNSLATMTAPICKGPRLSSTSTNEHPPDEDMHARRTLTTTKSRENRSAITAGLALRDVAAKSLATSHLQCVIIAVITR